MKNKLTLLAAVLTISVAGYVAFYPSALRDIRGMIRNVTGTVATIWESDVTPPQHSPRAKDQRVKSDQTFQESLLFVGPESPFFYVLDPTKNIDSGMLTAMLSPVNSAPLFAEADTEADSHPLLWAGSAGLRAAGHRRNANSLGELATAPGYLPSSRHGLGHPNAIPGDEAGFSPKDAMPPNNGVPLNPARPDGIEDPIEQILNISWETPFIDQSPPRDHRSPGGPGDDYLPLPEISPDPNNPESASVPTFQMPNHGTPKPGEPPRKAPPGTTQAFNADTVPEPPAWWLSILGLAVLGLVRRAQISR